MANVARPVIAASGWASSGAPTVVGTSLYATGSPTAFVEPWLTTFQYRDRSGAARRWASDSLASSVSSAVKALPQGLSGPGGTGTASTS